MNVRPTSMAMLLLLGNFLLNGCTKNPPTPPPTSYEKRLVKIEESATDITTLEYHLDGKLKKLTTTYEFGSGPEVSTFEYQYGNTDKVQTATISTGNSFKYVYTGSDVRIEFRDANNTTISYRTLHFQGEKLVTVTGYGFNGSNAILVGRIDYDYYADGNIKSETQYYTQGGVDLVLYEKRVYTEYDDKKNPFRLPALSGLILFPYQSPNNPRKQLVYDREDNLTSSIEYSYTYDERGYVKQCIVSEADMGYPPESYTLKFIYE
ncbi:MAG: hypothetical protein C5B52_13715 [Bacteroidetes bacterium]|nr:MAG: hypothetical protein C5B52_13715 [Bacteroidota bacterium]